MENFPVKLIDVSQYQDRVDTIYKPNFDKIVNEGFMGVGIREGFGIVKDRMWDWFWAKAKGKLARLPYWYCDYYSNKNKGMSGTDWGIEQANWAWDWYKADPGELPMHIDIEPSSYGGSFNILNFPTYAIIFRAFMTEWKRLSGKTCNIYCSPGYLSLFGDWFKDSDLWLAWYRRDITRAQVLAKVAAYGWRGKVNLWQYASDGDINNDGISDGLTLGMETANLDLNVFIRGNYTVQEFSAWAGTTPPPITPPTEDIPAQELPSYGATKLITLKTVTCDSGLNIRKDPTTAVYNVIGWLPNGKQVECLDIVINGGNIWNRVGQGQWCAEKYNGIIYMK